jgi:glycosyltransferase involved in cell wall biosynthesis
MQQSDIKISVIICAYNEEKRISACLNSIVDQILNRSDTELIIVDNESTDKTGQLVKNFIKEHRKSGLSATYVNIRHVPLTSSRNTGIKYAKGAFIIFMDADAVAEKRWLTNLVDGFTNADVMIVSGKVGNLNSHSAFSSLIYHAYYSAANLATYSKVNRSKLIGANMAFRREVFDFTGGFYGNVKSRGDETCVAKYFFSRHLNKKENYASNAVVLNEHTDQVKTWLKQQFQEGLSGAFVSRFSSKKWLRGCQYFFRFCNTLFFPFLIGTISGLFSYKALTTSFLLTLIRHLYKIKYYYWGIRNTRECLGTGKSLLALPICISGTFLLDFGYITGFFINFFKKKMLFNAPIGEIIDFYVSAPETKGYDA